MQHCYMQCFTNKHINRQTFLYGEQGKLFFDIKSVENDKDAVIRVMRKVLQWEDAETEKYRKELQQLILEAKYPSEN